MIKKIVAAFIALLIATPWARAQWTTLDLPSLSSPYGVGKIGFFSDGRFLYAAAGEAWIQDSWGSASFTGMSAENNVFDPSFVLLMNDSLAYFGSGGWGSSAVFSLNPSVPATPGFAGWGAPVSNYQAVAHDATAIYLGGNFGSATNGFGSPKHSISLFDGVTNQVLIDNISDFSAGFDRDAAGNLYVGSADDNKVYFFSAAQLDAALNQGPLSLGDGMEMHAFQSSSSVAVDGLGRVWVAGYMTTGIEVYDPNSGTSGIFVPGATNANYQVVTFMQGGDSYVGWLNNKDWATGADMNYGYAQAAAIPEPSAALLLWLGGPFLVVAGLLVRRRSSPKL